MPILPQLIRISDYTYHLPEERVAKHPLSERDASKLLVFKNNVISPGVFPELIHQLGPNDLMIFNQSKVIPSRLIFRKNTGALMEVFCLGPADGLTETQALSATTGTQWACMVRGLKKWKNGALAMEIPALGVVLSATLNGKTDEEGALVCFEWGKDTISFAEILAAAGELPIPPYLNRKTDSNDLVRYQTVYAQSPGSVAAPTAGLHFTPQLLDRVREGGTRIETVTLHVGAGTFLPVKSEKMADHPMHSESVELSVGLLRTISSGHGSIMAVGTTSMRSLESLYWWCVRFLEEGVMPDQVDQWAWTRGSKLNMKEAFVLAASGLEEAGIESLRFKTRLLIAPGYCFAVVDRLVTNFHQPGSTLLLLVAAFVGPAWKEIYQYALDHDFRFLSYGDSSVLHVSRDAKC